MQMREDISRTTVTSCHPSAGGKRRTTKKEKRMNIINFIPTGHKNAITRYALQTVTHLGDRKIRELIAEVNANDNPVELIINLQDGKGYFRPAPGEDDLVRIWQATERSRGASVNENVRAAEAYLNRHKKKAECSDDHQMTFADWLSDPGKKVDGCQTES